MYKPKTMLAAGLLCAASAASGQIVDTQPAPLQQDSRDVKIIYHADQGSRGLQGYAGDVYAHTGVITSQSASSSDWKHAPAWGDNAPKYKMARTGADTYELAVGDIAAYYGLDASESVRKLAFVFRSGDCSREGKTTAGGDIFVDVADSGFQVQFAHDAASTVAQAGDEVTFTLTSTREADLRITVNGTQVASQRGTRLVAPYLFAQSGAYRVEGAATAEGQTLARAFDFVVPGASAAVDYPGGAPRMGAVEQPDGTVVFCVAAPQKGSVLLCGSWDGYAVDPQRAMNYQDYQGNRYFWTSVSGLDRDTEYYYYYIVDGTVRVADPYAKLVLDPYSDKWLADCRYPYGEVDDNTVLAVYQGSIDDYDWQVDNFRAPAREELVVYEMLLRDFTGTEGEARGDGTINAAYEKLDYVRSLGVNAVELMPVMEFNGNNSWGYNTNFYMALDKAYGTPDDMRRFVDRCHELGMAVVLDIVLNHSDGLHPWYQMYPREANPFYNATAPHDWSVLNDFRQEHPLVRQMQDDAVRYWMEAYRVDGFRFDLVKGMGDSDSYGRGTEALNESRIANMKRLHAVIKGVNPRGIHINEFLGDAAEENRYAQDGQLNWNQLNEASRQYADGRSEGSDLAGFYAPNWGRAWGSTVSYAESHDEERLGYSQLRNGANDYVKRDLTVRMHRLGSLAAQMLLSPGAHMVWQFGELGDEQTTKSGGGNDTSPKRLNWSYLDDEDRSGLRRSYAELIHVRRDNPALFGPGADVAMNFAASDWGAGRRLRVTNGEDEIILLANPDIKNAATVSYPARKLSAANHQVLSASHGAAPVVTFGGGSVSCTLGKGQYVVVGTASLAGVEDLLAAQNDYTVRPGIGQITVEGRWDTLEVYDLAGRRVANAGLSPGVYIAVVDGASHKVRVR